MEMATSPCEVGIRDLENNLSRHLARDRLHELAAAAPSNRLDGREHDMARTGLAMLVVQLRQIEVIIRLVVRASDLAEAEALRGYGAVHRAAAVAVGADVFAASPPVNPARWIS